MLHTFGEVTRKVPALGAAKSTCRAERESPSTSSHGLVAYGLFGQGRQCTCAKARTSIPKAWCRRRCNDHALFVMAVGAAYLQATSRAAAVA